MCNGQNLSHRHLAALNNCHSHREKTCHAHFLGAATDFTNHDSDNIGAVAFGRGTVLRNVHMDSHSIAEDTPHIVRTAIAIVNENMFEGDLAIELNFWGDQKNHFGIL